MHGIYISTLVFPLDDHMKRFVVIGGDAATTRLWVGDSTGSYWRKSVELPYNGGTVYNPTIVTKGDR